MYSILDLIDSWRIVAFVLCLPLIYWLLTKNFNHWTKIGVNGPKPVLIFGNFLDRVLNPLANLDMKYMKTFGNIYGVFNGTDPVLHVLEPELIKQILVKDFHYFNNRRELKTEHPIINKTLFNSRDEDWKRMRSITSSTFTSGKMKRMYALVRKCLQEYLDALDVLAKEGKDIDVKRMHQNLTMDVIASCAFATQTNTNRDLNNPFVENCRKIFDFKATKVIPQFIFPKSLNKLLNITSNVDESANQWIFNLSRHIIEKRRNGEKRNDFIQLLIDAKAEESTVRDKNDELEAHYVNEGVDEIAAEKKAFNVNFANKTLTEDEMLAQSWIFLVAGFETTASTLAYASYELALNPESQEKLFTEVMSSMDSNREISYETLQEMPFLDAVITETLRLYPPLTRLERVVNDDYNLGDTGIKLFKGQMVEIPVYAIHHSEQYYKNADQFIPQRFLAENRHQLVPYTYLPFGTGPRNCIGMRFGLMEVKLAIAHIVMRYRLTQCDKTVTHMEFQKLSPMLSAKSIVVGIEKRYK